jgi:hypothetical protein
VAKVQKPGLTVAQADRPPPSAVIPSLFQLLELIALILKPKQSDHGHLEACLNLEKIS